ncbi:hypothetical protein ACWGK9_35740, partial [Streptomyces rubiginosohelvolus]
KAIETLVKQRMNNLRSTLAKFADVTVQCPDCEQWAMLAYNGEEGPRCLFCHQIWPNDAPSGAANYAWIILGQDEVTAVQDGGDPPVVACPECGVSALVTEAITAECRPQATGLCFACGNTFGHLVDCEFGCGTVLNISPDDVEALRICSDCIGNQFGRD